ncbi:MAG: YitT family protein [Sporolactobacillus sp.]
MLKKIIFVGIGAAFIGIGINGFIIPFHLINGGVIGLSILLKYTLDVHLGMTIILINLPLYLYSLVYEREYFFNGLLGVLASASMIEAMAPFRELFHLSIFWSSLSGGAFIGIGIGLMLRQHVSHGAVDLIALLISKYLKINPGMILLTIDLSIIVLGMIVLRDGKLVYSLFTVGCVGFLSSLLTSVKSVSFMTNRKLNAVIDKS